MDAPSLYALLICGVLVVKFFLIGCIVRYRKEQKKEYQLQLRRKTLKPRDDEEEVASSNKGDPEIGDDADDWGLARSSSSSSSARGSEVDTSSRQQDAEVHQEVNTNDDVQGAGLDVDEYLDQFEMNATSITEQQGEEETADGEVVRQKQQEDQRDVEIRRQTSWDDPHSVAAADEKLENERASSTSSSDSEQETARHPQETSSVTFQIDTDVATMPQEVEVVGNNSQDTADDGQDDEFITISL